MMSARCADRPRTTHTIRTSSAVVACGDLRCEACNVCTNQSSAATREHSRLSLRGTRHPPALLLLLDAESRRRSHKVRAQRTHRAEG
jgi:hypothetical protein